MSQNHAVKNYLASAQRSWYRFLGRLLHVWVKSTCMPSAVADWGIDPDKPVFYVLDTYALSSVLILDQLLEQADKPLASSPLCLQGVAMPRSYGANRRYSGMLFRTLKRQRHSSALKSLVQQAKTSLDQGAGDIQIVPVSILIGRAPDSEAGFFDVLFSESWGNGGRIRRLMSTLIHGRHTLVQVRSPILLSDLFEQTQDPDKVLARISRIARVYFKRTRSAAIGPDRSHLRTLLGDVVQAEPVQQAIQAKARRERISEEKARTVAYGYAKEIAANYSYSFVLIANKVLTWFLYRIFRGVQVQHFDSFRELATGHEVVYVPCHRSHIDYLLLSYILYHRGLAPPHVAAGVNLNLPFVGSLIRRGGGFFLRRSFRSKPLYAAVFNQYVATILSKGVSLEYFIEGGRSRTGRLLPPKVGMLSMTLRAFLAQQQRPILFQPVSIAYERLAEGDAYIAELSGQNKKPESLSDFKNVFNVIRKNYGEVTVSFGDPIFLDRLLDKHAPAWRDQKLQGEDRPEWLSDAVDDLAHQILVNINKAAHVTPITLLSIALLATPRQTMDEQDLKAFLQRLQTLFMTPAYSDRVTVTPMSPEQIIEYGCKLEVVHRQAQPPRAVIGTDEKTAVLLSYFKNNATHLMAISGWLACCYLNLNRIKRTRLHSLTERVYPFFKNELFLPWSSEQLAEVVDQNIQMLIDIGLLEENGEGMIKASTEGQGAHHLRLLANSMGQTFERYFIVLATLIQNETGKVTKQQLGPMCRLCAQRVSMLHSMPNPEFGDRGLLLGFVDALQKQGLVQRNEEGFLVFDEGLTALYKDARLVLDREVYYTITQSVASPEELDANETS